MNKIAAYEAALSRMGAGDGPDSVPAAYAEAFARLEKEAGILDGIGRLAGSVGKSVGTGLKRVGMQGGPKGGVKVFGKNISGRQLGYGTMGAGGLAAGGLIYGAGKKSGRQGY